jgi:hypothetical protein
LGADIQCVKPPKLQQPESSNTHYAFLFFLIGVILVLPLFAGIEHDIKIWAPTSNAPHPPNPNSLRAAMAANKRQRDAARDAMGEPEQWLLQLLAAQRRRWA